MHVVWAGISTEALRSGCALQLLKSGVGCHRDTGQSTLRQELSKNLPAMVYVHHKSTMRTTWAFGLRMVCTPQSLPCGLRTHAHLAALHPNQLQHSTLQTCRRQISLASADMQPDVLTSTLPAHHYRPQGTRAKLMMLLQMLCRCIDIAQCTLTCRIVSAPAALDTATLPIRVTAASHVSASSGHCTWHDDSRSPGVDGKVDDDRPANNKVSTSKPPAWEDTQPCEQCEPYYDDQDGVTSVLTLCEHDLA